jgi:ribulose-phosphate 3-epimerase
LEVALSDNEIKIAPSILSADFARLGDQVTEATDAGADYIHVDVMDGRFVPNITIGAQAVGAMRKHTKLPLDVHLMIENPERHYQEFVNVGANIITVHVEACLHIHRVIQMIKGTGVKAGVSLNPGTSVTAIENVIKDVDLVLVMTVNPGWSGQNFIENTLDKVAEIREWLDESNLLAELEVDGGINTETAPKVVEAGAKVLVAGSAIFSPKHSIADGITRIRQSVADLHREE